MTNKFTKIFAFLFVLMAGVFFLLGSADVEIAMPFDPGENGKLTLLGIDSDNDGVRDDVQIAIKKRYPLDMNKQSILTKLAKGIQKSFIAQNINNSNELQKALQNRVDATACITYFSSNPLEDIVFIEMLMTNTEDRSKIFFDINSIASGNILSVSENNSCIKKGTN